MSTTRQRNLNKAAFTNAITNSSGGSSPCTGNCTKKVSCAMTQKMSATFTLQNQRGGPTGSTGLTRCTPGPGFTVSWDKIFGSLYIDGPASSKGEGCNGVCPGCPADYEAKKQSWISTNGKTTVVKANGTWPVTTSACPIGCSNRCYKPSFTRPKNDPVKFTLNWGCGPCDKKVPCSSCGKKTVSTRALNLVKQTLRSI